MFRINSAPVCLSPHESSPCLREKSLKWQRHLAWATLLPQKKKRNHRHQSSTAMNMHFSGIDDKSVAIQDGVM